MYRKKTNALNYCVNKMSDLVGIIYPPPDLRGIVDKTAQYVAKNGSILENKIKQDHSNNPKFSFLLNGDPFNAYYQHKVQEFRNNLLEKLNQQQEKQPVQNQTETETVKDDNDSSSSQNNNNADQQQQQLESDEQDDHHKSIDEASNHEAADENESSTKFNDNVEEKTEPPPLNFLADPAPSITHMESDLIKLTCQFIATYGRSFLVELIGWEQNNGEFDFLKPQHGQFKYMTNLIMQYSLVRNYPLDIMEQLRNDSSSQRHVLDKIKQRAEWEKMLESEIRKREEEHRRDQLQYAQIDWHDFEIVETVDYQPDEQGDYPPPTTADQVGTRYLKQQRLAEEEMDIEM